MSLKEELEELMKEGQTQEDQVDDFVASLNKQLGILPGGGKTKPVPKLTPEQAYEAQWKAVATVLAVDVRTCQSCGHIHTMPIGFFLEQIHPVAQSTDRRLTQIQNSIQSMPDLYRTLPSKLEEEHSTVGFCHLCFGLTAVSRSHPFYTHANTSFTQTSGEPFVGPLQEH